MAHVLRLPSLHGPALWLAMLVAAQDASAQPVTVKVRKDGDAVIVDVTARVAADAQAAWAVLTDYDHMADFVSAVRESRVIGRNGNLLEVAQTGGAKRGFFDFSFSTLRSVELVPETEIRSRLIRGDFKSYEFTTRLVREPAAPGVTITHHGEYVPNVWVPPVVGPALIEAETRRQYGDLIAEMLRRQRGDRPAGAASTPP